jgi:hypothetical protein
LINSQIYYHRFLDELSIQYEKVGTKEKTLGRGISKGPRAWRRGIHIIDGGRKDKRFFRPRDLRSYEILGIFISDG